MKIHIPNSAFLGNIDSFLKSISTNDGKNLYVTAHDQWVSVHPMVLCMLAAYGKTVSPANIHFKKMEAKSKGYFERMGLFKFMGLDSGIQIREHESAGRFVPLTQIKNSDELTDFIQDVTPLLHLEPVHADPIKYIMSELIRNVLEHSLSKNGAFVMAQYYKKANVIRIGIADTGVGIWHTINQSYNPKNDLEAIKLALMPGVTGTTNKEGGTEYNAGAGLFFIKSIASVNRNFFCIYSGKGMYKLLKRKSKITKLYADPFEDKHSARNDLPSWHGTAVGIDISLEATQEFSVLLKLINQTYNEAIKERKKARYRKPQFI